MGGAALFLNERMLFGMSLLDRLCEESAWQEYRQYKSIHGCMTLRESEGLDLFIKEKRYLPIAKTLEFSVPERKSINKSGGKKRLVYILPEDESRVLKLLTWLMYKYDGAFEPCCYSFRKGCSARDAFSDIFRIRGLSSKYVLKLDIHDYFNSMPSKRLCEELAEVITDDPQLLAFLTRFYMDGRASAGGMIITEDRGAMAGIPLSAFCANIYLAPVDRHFESLGVPYFRYSDDILMMFDSKNELDEGLETFTRMIEERGLSLNPDKLAIAGPGEAWSFLGFKYEKGRLDLSDVTVSKMKAKIRRKARSLYRWRIRKDASYDRAATAMIRRFNRKFYDPDGDREFTWSRWFFPLLTRTDGLHELDAYLADKLRWLYTGRTCKANYAVTYSHLKELGFRSLVNEYYRSKKEEGEQDAPEKEA